MGIDTEYLEQLKATVTELKQIVSAIQIEEDGSINANIKGDVTIDSVSIKDSSTNNRAKVDENGNLLVSTNFAMIDSFTIKDPINQNNKAKVDDDGKLFVKTDIVQLESFSIKDSITNANARVDSDGKLLVKTDLTLIDSFVIRDANNPLLRASIDSSGRLLVATPPPVNPPDTTPVVITAFGDVNGNVDSSYTITNGKTLHISRLLAGAEETTKACRVTLYENPSGTTLNLIATLYVNGSSDRFDLSQIFVGNGVRKIILRRTNLGTGSKEVFARFEGYEE